MGDAPTRSLGDVLAKVVPGTALRDGLERVLRARMGALVVLGDNRDVLEICSGGFHIDAEMTPQRLSELAKMDGAIILDGTGARIAWANVHLVPDPSAPTTETGTRHRTAERVARCVDVAVVAVSEEMGTITLYSDGERRVLRSPEHLVARANHLLQILERFREQLDAVNASLTASEIGDVVTLRDVATLLQRAEMVTRVAGEVADLLDELGDHGRLLRLRLDELITGVVDERRLVLEDYAGAIGPMSASEVQARLARLPTDDLLGLERVVATVAAATPEPIGLDDVLSPRGLRILHRLPQLPAGTVALLADRFGDLQSVVRATAGEISGATGLDESGARLVKDGLARVVEASILDRYT